MKSISEIIDWWENKLTGEQRQKLLKGYVWCGSTEERHKKLREMYEDVEGKEEKPLG